LDAQYLLNTLAPSVDLEMATALPSRRRLIDSIRTILKTARASPEHPEPDTGAVGAGYRNIGRHSGKLAVLALTAGGLGLINLP